MFVLAKRTTLLDDHKISISTHTLLVVSKILLPLTNKLQVKKTNLIVNTGQHEQNTGISISSTHT